jgi:hypothetical protein
MIELSEKTKRVINAFFPEDASGNEVSNILLMECAENIPFCEDSNPERMERIRFSVLKLGNGDIQKLKEAVELAQIDWRDLFIAAGFSHAVEAHENWYKQVIKS